MNNHYLKFSFFAFLAVFFLFVIGYFIFFRGISEAGDINSGANKENSMEEIESINSDSAGQNLESGLESSSSSSAGGGGGGGGGSSGGSSGQTFSQSGCQETQIAYAVKDINLTQSCSDFFEGVCQKKQISCSAGVFNLDYSVSGDFVINFLFFDVNNQDEFIESGSEEKTISPRGNLIFEVSREITGANANIDFGCSFETLSVPKKEIC